MKFQILLQVDEMFVANANERSDKFSRFWYNFDKGGIEFRGDLDYASYNPTAFHDATIRLHY